MKKKYKVNITNSTTIEVDVNDGISDDELLDKIETEIDKGYQVDSCYFEIEGEVDINE